jgi:16S rRNA processing protein RimM
MSWWKSVRESSLKQNPKDDPCDICVGIVIAPHGLGGEVSVEPLSAHPQRFAPGARLTLNRPQGPLSLVVADVRPHQGRFLVRFEGIASLEDAETLRGARLYIRRSQLAPLADDEYYEFQIVGLRVRTQQGTQLGSIKDILHTGANDVFVTEQVLVPAIHAAIASIDLQAGEVVVRDDHWAVPARPK